MNILVTGANGQLGQEFRVILDEMGNGHPDHTTAEKNYYIFTDHGTLDITNKEAVDDFIIKNFINIVINCAAYTNVDLAEDEPEKCYAVNTYGVKNLYDTCERCGAKLINFSTDYVFDNSHTAPIPRNAPTNPLSVYGKCKSLAEELSPNAITFRVSWLYSLTSSNNFLSKILNKIKKGETVKVIDTQVGCPTNAHGLAKYVIHIIEDFNHENGFLLKKGVYNYCDEKAYTWYEFAKSIEEDYRKLTGQSYWDTLVQCGEYPQKAQRPRYSVLDCMDTWEIFGKNGE